MMILVVAEMVLAIGMGRMEGVGILGGKWNAG